MLFCVSRVCVVLFVVLIARCFFVVFSVTIGLYNMSVCYVVLVVKCL